MGKKACQSDFRQHAGKDFQSQVLLVAQSVCATLDDANLVVESLDEAERNLVFRVAVGGQYHSEFELCTKELDAASEWAKLAADDRAAILREVQLSASENAPKLGTLAELIDSLTVCTPQRWGEKRDALRGQLTRALSLTSKKLEPSVQPVTPPRRLLRSEAALDKWVAEVRQAVLEKLPNGPVQL